jgi:hypothetical protein
MKSPDAQAEVVCIKEGNCCISLMDMSKLLDIISKVSHAIEATSYFKGSAMSLIEDIEMAKNATIKARNSLEAFIKTIRNSSEKSFDEAFIYTMSNTLNRLVEVRNRLCRISEVVEGTLDSVKAMVLNGIMQLDTILVRFSLIALAFAVKVKKWSRETAGVFASAIASALFASLLSLSDNEYINETLRKCI